MSAHTTMACNYVPGREAEARALLRDYAAWLEGHGAQVTVYRAMLGGEATGRILLFAAAPDTTARAAFLDSAVGDRTSSPLVKPMEAASPPLTNVVRIMVRSTEPDLPILPASWLRRVGVYTAAIGDRAQAEQALRTSRLRFEELGVTSAGYVIEVGGESTDRYLFIAALDSFAAMDELDRKNAAMPPTPGSLFSMAASGMITPGARRVDVRLDL